MDNVPNCARRDKSGAPPGYSGRHASARTGAQEATGHSTGAVCPRCHHKANVTPQAPVCASCRARVRIEAASAQELAYLGAWLSSRVDAKGKPLQDSALTMYPHERRQIARCVRVARARRIDWMHPAAPLRFDDRIAAIMAAYRTPQAPLNKRGRPAQRPQVQVPTQAPHRTSGALALASEERIEEGASYGR